LARLSATRGKNAKTKILTEAFARATPLEAKYLVKRSREICASVCAKD